MTHPQTRKQLLELSRGLRNLALPTSELAQVPLTLQRLDLRDHVLFDEFCHFTAIKWKELKMGDMAAVFRNTEEYHLLHASKGTALCRLVDSLAPTVPQAEAQDMLSPRALASLCHGALTPKCRAVVRPLLLALREHLANVDGVNGVEAVELLAAAAELHRAIGVSTTTLRTLAQKGQEALQEAALLPNHLSLLARVSARLALVLPKESEDLMKALIEALQTREASERERVFPACRQLPVHLRRLLAESGLLYTESGSDFKASLKRLETRLHIVHDLPLHAAIHGHDLAAVITDVKALLNQILDQQLPASTAAVGYLTVTTVQYSLTVAEASPDVDLQRMSLQFLSALRWEDVTPQEVQWLFRSPGDVSEAVSEASKNANHIQDPQALATLLQAAKVPGTEGLAEVARNALLERLRSMKNVRDLAALEAAIRKGPVVHDAEDDSDLRERIRRRLFKSVLDSQAVYDARPNRGFIRFVEQLLAKDRAPKESSASQELPEAEAEELPKTSDVAAVEDVKKGVYWHPGVQGWEVKLEVAGRRIVGGYFIPEKDENDQASQEAVEIEKQRALQCHENLEKRYREAQKLQE